ncbi:MAG: DoxX [Candidatus Angelobacter sp.]|nr:DoxX [Candidatus Angelobacter sp.]
MHLTALAMFLETSRTAVGMCSAGVALFLIGILAAKNDIAEAQGLDKIVALSNLCFAVPLAVFGALHLFGPQFVLAIVPRYMPWRLFWVYFIGGALIAASLSIATKIGVRWSGLLFGTMMFLFVAMIHFPGALRQPHNRIIWTIVVREMSFGGGGWILAAMAKDGWRGQARTTLITLGRIAITLALIFFAIEHFLHPLGLPGVPLQKEMPSWMPVPGRMLIDYMTGAALLAAGGSFLLPRKTRSVAACVGGWLLLLVLVIYGPVLIGALSDPRIGVELEGINYFADTLLFAGVILALASAAPRSDVIR